MDAPDKVWVCKKRNCNRKVGPYYDEKLLMEARVAHEEMHKRVEDVGLR